MFYSQSIPLLVWFKYCFNKKAFSHHSDTNDKNNKQQQLQQQQTQAMQRIMYLSIIKRCHTQTFYKRLQSPCLYTPRYCYTFISQFVGSRENFSERIFHCGRTKLEFHPAVERTYFVRYLDI